MKKLTAKEEEVMHILWELKKAFVKEIIDKLPSPKPHYNTVSTLVRRLESLGYIGYEKFGNTHRYYPLIKKDDYKEQSLKHMLRHYFNNSYQSMVSFFAKENKISPEELREILNEIEKDES